MSPASSRVRPVVAFLIAALLCQYGGVRAYAAQAADRRQASAARERSRPPAELLGAGRFDALLVELREVVGRARAKTVAAPARGFSEIEKLAELKRRLGEEREKVQAYFARVGGLIGEKALPAEIRNRHADGARAFEAKYVELTARLEEIESAHAAATGFFAALTGRGETVRWGEVIDKTLSFLDENASKAPRRHFDPHNLPHRSLKADRPAAPKLTREEWQKAFPQEQSAPARPGAQKARGATAAPATAPPTPADLAETVEVQFTPEIRQLADSLGKNPVRIFNWVRNNVEFTPTWGSIQGAQLCLETRTCNAFDASSLLIALLRYSGIHARYQMGTIEVPVEKFRNWAGGFTNTESATSLFASGGVPSVVRRVGGSGQVASVRLEHVWVKAFVGYSPSGGAVHLQGDTWVEMDSSFKQHTLSSPLQDLTSIVPFNRDAYLSSSAQNSPVEFYQQALAAHVQQNHPGRTLDDFLCKKTIKVLAPPVLGGALPYKLLTAGVSFSNLPDELRQRVTVRAGRPEDSSPLTYTAPLPTLLGKRLTLSFMPAAPADLQVATDFAGLYRTPPYLISVKPVLRVDGQEVAAGQPLGMGQQLQMTFTLDLPGLGQRPVQNTITAGAYLAILVAPHHFNEALGDKLAREFRRSDDRFGTLNLNNSDRDPSVGGMLQVLSSYYFKRLDESIATLKQFFPVGQLKTAFAAYVSSDVEADSLFGAPAALRFTGISIDADLLEDVALAKDGTTAPAVSFERLRGLESSYLEHRIFGPEEAKPEQPAVSTVRALQQAKRDGVTIHEINAGNLAAIEPQLQVAPEVKEAIRDAVGAGLVVTIPASDLQLGVWRGVGYIVEDPTTGAGAYQISGGLSGGAEPIPFLQPHLLGAPPPSSQPRVNPRWPTAIVAVGWPVDGGSLDRRGALDRMITRLVVNQWTVSDSIGFQIYSRGYNVYTADVDGDTFMSFVEGTGVRTDFDVFCYIGPTTLSGQILLDDEDDNLFVFGPGSFPRNFWISYLSGNTGGSCRRVDSLISCNKNESQMFAWWDALGSRPDEPLAGAVIGFWNQDYLAKAKFRADIFWQLMASGSDANDAAVGLAGAVYILCGLTPETPACPNVLRGYGQ